MDDNQKDQISQALHDGLYGLLGDDVTEMETIESLRTGIHLVNDQWGIDTGHRPDPEEPVQHKETYPREFHDMKTGSWLSITETELVVLGGASMDPGSRPNRYPLEDVESIRLDSRPGHHGLTSVYPRVTGRLVEPPPRFGALSYALDFADALRTATGIRINEEIA